MAVILACSVMLHGAPVGDVSLDILGTQGLGTLVPRSAFSNVRPRLQAVSELGPQARIELLTLPRGASTSHPAIAEAALPFTLADREGMEITAVVVRMAELSTRPGVTVLVEFGEAMAGVVARVLDPASAPGASATPAGPAS